MSIGIKYQERDEKNFPLEDKQDSQGNDYRFSCESNSGIRLHLTKDNTIVMCIPHDDWSEYEFRFPTQQDWEDFGYEVSKETENYIAVKKTDFVEFFNAMKFVRSYQSNQIDQARQHLAKVQSQIERDETSIKGMDEIMARYEEVYNENKVQ